MFYFNLLINVIPKGDAAHCSNTSKYWDGFPNCYWTKARELSEAQLEEEDWYSNKYKHQYVGNQKCTCKKNTKGALLVT